MSRAIFQIKFHKWSFNYALCSCIYHNSKIENIKTLHVICACAIQIDMRLRMGCQCYVEEENDESAIDTSNVRYTGNMFIKICRNTIIESLHHYKSINFRSYEIG